MQDTTQKGHIDLDELVDTLMRERAETKATSPTPVEVDSSSALEMVDIAIPTDTVVEPVDAPETPITVAPIAHIDTSRPRVSPADIFAAMLAENELEDEEEEDAVADNTEQQPLLIPTEQEAEQQPEPEAMVESEANSEPEIEVKPEAKLEPEAEVASDLTPAPQRETKEKTKKPKRGLFGRRRHEQETADEEEWADWDLKPIGHYKIAEANKPVVEQSPMVAETTADADVMLLTQDVSAEVTEEPTEETQKPVEAVDEFPSVQPVDETITMPIPMPVGATRVIDVSEKITVNKEEPPVQPELIEEEVQQLPDQLSMEEMVRVEDMEEQPEGMDEDPGQRLQRTRLEKIREFTINGEEEEENEPEEEAVTEEPEEEPEIEDFTSYEDTKAVQHELRYRCRTAALSMLFTGLLEAVLMLLTIITAVIGDSPITRMGYLTVQMFGLCLMLVLNYTVVSRGLSGLFQLTANGDSGPALATLVTLFSIVPYFTDSTQTLPVWAPVAGLLMLFSAIAQYLQARRVMCNFAFVSYPAPKYAASLVEDEKVLHEVGRRAAVEGDASIGYFRRTAFLSDYLTNAYEPDSSAEWARWMTPVALCLSIVGSVMLSATGYLEGFWAWLQTFVGMLCLSMPPLSLAVQLPLANCCRRMMARGGFLVGWKAVRRFSHPDGLAVDVADLYPDESMLLHGIKTFSGTHIDDAILDAASLSVRAGGPLSLIFRRIIENKESLLHEVDSLVYEHGMGVSGWVDGRRVLVGNRRLLENHGVDVPSADYEARYAKDNRRLVYLSTAGELSAMFVVSYLPDAAIKMALQRLCRSRMMLFIRSCDQNITAETLCADFELSEYQVDVLPAVAGRLYGELTDGESESASAELASNGHILGTAQAISACRTLHVKATIALVVHTLLAVIGMVLCVMWAIESSVMLFLGAFGLSLGSAILSWVLPIFKRS